MSGSGIGPHDSVRVAVVGAGAFGRPPRDRGIERVIHFEDARPVAVSFQAAPELIGKSRARNCQKLPRRHVAHDDSGFG